MTQDALHGFLSGCEWASGAAVVALFTGLLARVTPWARRWVGARRQRELAHVQRELALDMLVKEFSPNGGRSLKDQVSRMERNQMVIARKVGVAIEELE